MKRSKVALATLLICLIGSAPSMAQQKPLTLPEVESLIQKEESELKAAERKRASLRVRYTESYPGIKEQTERIVNKLIVLKALYAQRSNLKKQKEIRELPKSQIGLLRKIAMQNIEIIELLRALVQKPN